jgi:hypothetical protein
MTDTQWYVILQAPDCDPPRAIVHLFAFGSRSMAAHAAQFGTFTDGVAIGIAESAIGTLPDVSLVWMYITNDVRQDRYTNDMTSHIIATFAGKRAQRTLCGVNPARWSSPSMDSSTLCERCYQIAQLRGIAVEQERLLREEPMVIGSGELAVLRLVDNGVDSVAI